MVGPRQVCKKVKVDGERGTGDRRALSDTALCITPCRVRQIYVAFEPCCTVLWKGNFPILHIEFRSHTSKRLYRTAPPPLINGIYIQGGPRYDSSADTGPLKPWDIQCAHWATSPRTFNSPHFIIGCIGCILNVRTDSVPSNDFVV